MTPPCTRAIGVPILTGRGIHVFKPLVEIGRASRGVSQQAPRGSTEALQGCLEAPRLSLKTASAEPRLSLGRA
eukprot:6320590-Prymnesium_polylepis.1